MGFCDLSPDSAFMTCKKPRKINGSTIKAYHFDDDWGKMVEGCREVVDVRFHDLEFREGILCGKP